MVLVVEVVLLPAVVQMVVVLLVVAVVEMVVVVVLPAVVAVVEMVVVAVLPVVVDQDQTGPARQPTRQPYQAEKKWDEHVLMPIRHSNVAHPLPQVQHVEVATEVHQSSLAQCGDDAK